ncbi:hypothetical protein Syun_011963 [Stephania yunnanensis]|uniref:Uncharacterized protein n=1 Tax=Stephania yunnanensis TaxID=152371 RepID=A0AAP0JZU6_9MAGN
MSLSTCVSRGSVRAVGGENALGFPPRGLGSSTCRGFLPEVRAVTKNGASFCNGPDLLEETPCTSKLPRTSWRKSRARQSYQAVALLEVWNKSLHSNPGHSPLPQLEPEPLETQVLRLMELCTIEPGHRNKTSCFGFESWGG